MFFDVLNALVDFLQHFYTQLDGFEFELDDMAKQLVVGTHSWDL